MNIDKESEIESLEKFIDKYLIFKKEKYIIVKPRSIGFTTINTPIDYSLLIDWSYFE